ncbi:unnamed protein product [Fusarium graminearum]|uniref:Chromosome 1, complete genome n=1 Tax=Gibberella zeae (strain ATCC MYA-4620 / CBS 123657 / FGSC 9075 / NRRL 31084 / PH-1) TaxID=229533 RepID=A0A098D0V1_GIBZE|nr:unnamed protein product [Fusarium graminearum]CZS75807.1 unnamed protein product [Fusarium graminearum]
MNNINISDTSADQNLSHTYLRYRPRYPTVKSRGQVPILAYYPYLSVTWIGK